METNSMCAVNTASPLETNQKKARAGIEVLASWKDNLGHTPFNAASLDDGQTPFTEAQGMVEVLSALFATGRDNAERPSETNISDASIAAALDGISRLMSLSRLEADSFEYSRRQGKGGEL
ncbi:hypothetical protein [Parasphingorhabdus sp.]|uniref:hypothetical protein n=1 Tax=Parasphingorhabdus sp. TaxID=2709688 RepID=UPI002F9506A8